MMKRTKSNGFTLIEMLVVVLIIGMMAAVVVLSVGVTGRDQELEKESDRVFSLLSYVREQAEIQTREFGLLCGEHGYEFLTYDPRRGMWVTADADDAMRTRKLPQGLDLKLVIEGRAVVLQRPADAKDKTPHVMIFSNGDLTSFQLTLEREGGQRSITLVSDDTGKIEAQPMKEART
jgi:general secretion pathway protein H